MSLLSVSGIFFSHIRVRIKYYGSDGERLVLRIYVSSYNAIIASTPHLSPAVIIS